ncbi:MAG: VWA domain-containing protein [Phycisphaerales bacterium]|nr:VWA domain-containing protein [Phycisphaerales bacterium]
MTFGPVQFDQPWYLALIPALALAVWLIARRSLQGLGPAARWTALGIRLSVLSLICAALAEPSWRRRTESVSLLLVIDQSRSMPPAADAALKSYLETALRDFTPGDRLGVVTVAESGLAQVLPSAGVTPLQMFIDRVKTGQLDPGPREGTDIADALRLALAIKPEDTAGRILLFSDGNETGGSALAAAEAARSAGVPIDVLPVPVRIEREVVFDQLAAPQTGRVGQNISLRFVLTATRPTRGRITLTDNGVPVNLAGAGGADSAAMAVDLAAGRNVLTAVVPLTRGGPQQYSATFEPLDPADDTIPQNNTAIGVTFAATEGKVLVYVGQSGEMQPAARAAPLLAAMRDAALNVEVRVAAENAHRSLVELQNYDAVILFDVPAGDFNRKQQDELAAYVHDAGGGLVVVGGENSFGAGGWIGTRVADVLPVRLDPPQKRQIPRGALALIMHSCEMPDGNFWGQKTAQAAVDALSRLDIVGVIEFNPFNPLGGWVFPMAEKGDGVGVRNALNNMNFGDMQSFEQSFQMALDGLLQAKREKRAGQLHTIVISDGDPTGPSEGLLAKFIENKISVSTVLVFPHDILNGADAQRMQRIARLTKGTFYQVTSRNQLAQLPEIFTKEAQIVKRPLIWEGPAFSPQITGGAAEPMRGIRGLPPLTGYIVTADREGLSLVTARAPPPNPDPIVAQWQHGLGRAVAFTSDSSARWSSAWLGWSQFRSFWEQHVRWAMRPSGSANVSVTTTSRGGETSIVLTALNAEGDPLNFARFIGRVVGPTLKGSDIALRQTGPGRYEGTIPSADAGSYLLSFRYDALKADGTTVESGSVQAAVTRPFADEYRALTDNAPLLRQIKDLTGGRELNPAPIAAELFSRSGLKMPSALRPIWLAVTLVTVGLFLADVAVRRVRIDLLALPALLRRALRRAPAARDTQVDALKAAREKAQRQIAGRTAKQHAGVKFEASPGFPPGDHSGPLSKPPAPAAPAATAGQRPPPGPVPDDEEQGMSRLLRAKQRARHTSDTTVQKPPTSPPPPGSPPPSPGSGKPS